MELVISFLIAVIFAILISFGYGKQLTETPAGRPVLGAVGFLIVIAGYAWSKNNFEIFTELTMWFMICCFPILLGGAISAMLERNESTKAVDTKLENMELQHYSVLSDD